MVCLSGVVAGGVEGGRGPAAALLRLPTWCSLSHVSPSCPCPIALLQDLKKREGKSQKQVPGSLFFSFHHGAAELHTLPIGFRKAGIGRALANPQDHCGRWGSYISKARSEGSEQEEAEDGSSGRCLEDCASVQRTPEPSPCLQTPWMM